MNTEFMTTVFTNYVLTLSVILPNFFFAEGLTTGDGLKALGAGMAAIGVLGAGIGQGITGQGACLAIGRNPELAGQITKTMILAAGIAESGAIYALIISLLLIFV
ncbi:F0F1 ATP synthase subunit C [Spiroplasma sabaudiense Ar-1343]|uniref:ATP synthase subunit c n=1 Tax=Spiroplasma sabaudiense Ar-1343 TaxID=1276257 RepID=W6A919_9MOLU|nr:ATP synthase subunit C [Spiroplasma sabaudiense]AHI53461.1 F0F1 ATP synthase subunit C [Spiroplasma sabaudiense Ar-1343]